MLCTHFLLTEYSATVPQHVIPAPSAEPAVVPLPAPERPPSLLRRCVRRLARADLPALLYCA
jgi:hypothetical protein